MEEERLREEVAQLEREVASLRRKRDADRAGRTRAERELRRVLTERAATGSSSAQGDEAGQLATLSAPIKPIGVVRSPFPSRMGTPRQGMLAPATRGWIQLEGRLNPAEALDGIQQFSHVWIVFVFHQNTNASKAMLGDKGLKAKVRPPRLGGARVGLFSTRTPHRPNPIGLTIAKIERLERGVLHISGVDLVDGTPVLDIKPYLPRYDSLPHAAVPDWIDDEGATVREDAGKELHTGSIRSVHWTRESEEAVNRLLADGALRFYAAGEDDQLRQAIDEVLRLDPRSAFQRSLSAARGATDGHADTPAAMATFKVAFDSVEVEFAYPSHDVIRVLALRLRPPPASTENEEREIENEEDGNEGGEERQEEDERTQTTAVS